MDNFMIHTKHYLLKHIKKSFYNTSIEFWDAKEPTVDNMCGGFNDIHDYDIKSTKEVLDKLDRIKEIKEVLEVGSGIGRISTTLLYKYFDKIDLLERKKEFIDQARKNCQIIEQLVSKNIFDNFFNFSLEEFEFTKKYDMIFVQWVLEYLTDQNLDIFLQKAYRNLNENGVVFIKENVNSHREYISEEGSHIREERFFDEKFQKNGFETIYKGKADLGRDDLFDVNCWCLGKIKI